MLSAYSWFTFQYELIITVSVIFYCRIKHTFTFQYELIITAVLLQEFLLSLKIYISIWTNYNSRLTSLNLSDAQIYISIWTNYNILQHFYLHHSRHIYISIWTNYNRVYYHISTFLSRFTFQYELIITAKLKK